jgi:hypothetical protein
VLIGGEIDKQADWLDTIYKQTNWLDTIDEQATSCLAMGQLVHVVNLSCYEPLSQGPCSEESEWFILDSIKSGNYDLKHKLFHFIWEGFGKHTECIKETHNC